MKIRHALTCSVLAALVLLAAAALAAVRWSGVSAVYRHHAIATLRVAGLDSDEAAEGLRSRMAAEPRMREAAVARSAGDPGVWLVRLQFRAGSAEEAGRCIAAWLQRAEGVDSIEVVQATFYPLRVARPGAGDLVLGGQERVVTP